MHIMRGAFAWDEPTIALGLTWSDGDGSDCRVRLHGEPNGSFTPVNAARELGIHLEQSGATWRVVARPTRRVRLSPCAATMTVGLTDLDCIYHNGYQSWTDSVERPPSYSMPGLTRAPRRAVTRWVLDGSGDYSFARYGRGLQHGFGYCYLRKGDEVLFLGSLTEDLGLTTTYTNLTAATLSVVREAPAREIEAGERRELLSFALFVGTLDDCLSRWLELMDIRALPAPALVGFTSWYRHYDDIDQDRLSHDLVAFAGLLDGADVGSCTRVFQIDDGYAAVGDWTSPHAERFPDGMAAFAHRIRCAGLVPGLWMAPFVCSRDSLVHRDHPEWLLRDELGKPVMTGSHWNGAFALDTLLPEVREHVRTSLVTATQEWGFQLLKLDFLYAACMRPHGGMNRGELMADALDLLRASVADDVVFDLCGVPLMSAFGRTEYCRVGCDVGLDWDDLPHMRLLHRERVSTKNSLANTRSRAHLDGRAFRCDPDVFFLRDDVRLTWRQRLALLEADATLGGVLFTSDDVGSWGARQRQAWLESLEVFCERNGHSCSAKAGIPAGRGVAARRCQPPQS